jgi:hypothetical protein
VLKVVWRVVLKFVKFCAVVRPAKPAMARRENRIIFVEELARKYSLRKKK